MPKKLTPEQREQSKQKRRLWYKNRYHKNKEKIRKARKIAYDKNIDFIRKKDRERYAKNPLARKRIDVKSKYGEIALAAFDSIHNCQACGDEVKGRNKHIDHDHYKEKENSFRGILCSNCNIALGYLKNDPRRIGALLFYINRSTKGE